MYRTSIIDQEIEKLWAVFQLARCNHQADTARILLKAALLYLHVRGLQSPVRQPEIKNQAIDLEKEMEKIWGALVLGAKYGDPDFERTVFKKSLQQMFFKGLSHSPVIYRD
ncbi:MAG TPA: hypothetical protein VGL10_05550 [Gammaproteobacteria bacterium]